MFNINDFKATLNIYDGPAKSDLFSVELAGPENTVMPVSDLRFFCQAITVPGINLELVEYLPNGYGMPFSMPMKITPERLNCTFMVDSRHAITKFFHEWMKKIINYDISAGFFTETNGRYPYEIGYRKDYITTMNVKHYSTNDQNKYYLYTFYNVFPTELGTETLDWSSNDYSRLTVNFSYTGMKFQGSQQETT